MDAITKAVNDIKLSIDPMILEDAFISNMPYIQGVQYTLDARIEDEVIRRKVLTDVNGHNGREIKISLNGLVAERLEDDSYLIKIPRKLTNGRGISSVLNLEYTDLTKASIDTAGAYAQTSGIGTAANNLVNALYGPIQIGENTAKRIDDYTIWFKTLPYNYQESTLTCIVNYNNNMSELSPRSWHAFSHLCVLAAKAICYNRLNGVYAQGRLKGGAELSYVQGIVSEYADSLQMYNEYLIETWTTTAVLDDPVQKAEHLRLIINPRMKA